MTLLADFRYAIGIKYVTSYLWCIRNVSIPISKFISKVKVTTIISFRLYLKKDSEKILYRFKRRGEYRSKKTIREYQLKFQREYQEISESLKLDVNKVKSAIQNGKRNLKIKLQGRNEFKSFT